MKRMDKFVRKNEFYGYEELRDSDYIRHKYSFTKEVYELLTEVYYNINDDNYVIELVKKIYELSDFMMLQDSINVYNSIFERSRSEYINTYGRKLEFLYEMVCDEWQA